MSSPTTRRRRRGSAPPVVEAVTWPDEARMCAAVGSGLSYADAWEMSPLELRIHVQINEAWSIPPDEREGGARLATARDAASLLLGG